MGHGGPCFVKLLVTPDRGTLCLFTRAWALKTGWRRLGFSGGSLTALCCKPLLLVLCHAQLGSWEEGDDPVVWVHLPPSGPLQPQAALCTSEGVRPSAGGRWCCGECQ